MMIDYDTDIFTVLKNQAYAEGMDDGMKGENFNPFDQETQVELYESYEFGFMDGLFIEQQREQ
jgi:hypothetical protein